MLRSILSILLLTFGGFQARAADPVPDGPQQLATINPSAIPSAPRKEPTADSRQLVAVSAAFVRMPRRLAVELNLPIALPDSKGVQRVFGKEEYLELAKRMRSKTEVEIYPLPRLVTSDKKRALYELVKELRYPTEYHREPAPPNLFVPDEIEARHLGFVLEAKPVIQSTTTAYLDLSANVCRLLGYKTPEGKLVRVTSPQEKGNWLQDLTKWQLPSGVSSEPVIESTHGNAELLLNNSQILLMHGFADDADRITYVSLSMEILP